MSNAYQLRSMQLQLAQERLARLLIERGLPSVTADAIVASGTFQGVGHGAVVVADFTETRAVTSEPESFAALADVLAATHRAEQPADAPVERAGKSAPSHAHQGVVQGFL